MLNLVTIKYININTVRASECSLCISKKIFGRLFDRALSDVEVLLLIHRCVMDTQYPIRKSAE